MSRTNRDIKIKKVKKLRKNHLCKNHINYDNIFIDTSLCKKTEITSDFTGKTSSYSKTDSDPEIKLKQAAELWKRYSKIHLKGSTYLKYSNLIDKHIIPELGDICISQIYSVLLADFMNHKLKHGRIDKNGGLAASYVKNIMIIITEIINFSIDEGYSSPIRIKLHMPKNEKGEIRVMDKINQKTLEDYLFSHLTPTNMGILLSLNTGLRIGEICALKWSDIDFQKAILKVNSTVSRVKSDDENSSKSKLIIDTPKTQSSIREIPIISQLMKPLIFLYETRNSEYIISAETSFVSPRTFEYRFHTVLEKCRISPFNYHVLRHTFATRCIEGGVDIKSLSEILGHANVSVTLNTYVHSSIERKRELLEKISENTTESHK